MRQYQNYLHWSFLLASLGAVQAKLDLNSSDNVAVYWGQNSFESAGGKGTTQESLAHYCENDEIDVIPMAFDMMINGPGGVPEVDFSSSSSDCDVFEGTQLKNCPKIGKDIANCQKKGKTILLSIGGATYSEGGFKSEDEAKAGAKLIWETFGPPQEGSDALRPFGDSSMDGFDFDFEANVQHMAPFANELRALMDKDNSKQFFLTAAPQCPYPDASDKEILNGPVSIDAIWVQFYNNFCGVNNFNTDEKSSKYNFEEWDNWAKTVSQNPDVKVLVGVPADTTAASTGYIPASKLADVIEYSKKFESFGGVMMWDATQAYANQGFIDGVSEALGGPDSGSSSSSSSNEASTPTSAPSSTNPAETSPSSNVPGSSSSSSSSSQSGSSSSGPEEEQPVTQNPPAAAPAPAATTKAPAKPATPTSTEESTTEPTAKPTTKHTTTPEPAPTTPADNEPSKPQKPAKPAKPAKPTKPAKPEIESPVDVDVDLPEPPKTPNVEGVKGKGGKGASVHALLGTDLMGLLNGLKQANEAVGGMAHGLLSPGRNMRHGNRIDS